MVGDRQATAEEINLDNPDPLPPGSIEETPPEKASSESEPADDEADDDPESGNETAKIQTSGKKAHKVARRRPPKQTIGEVMRLEEESASSDWTPHPNLQTGAPPSPIPVQPKTGKKKSRTDPANQSNPLFRNLSIPDDCINPYSDATSDAVIVESVFEEEEDVEPAAQVEPEEATAEDSDKPVVGMPPVVIQGVPAPASPAAPMQPDWRKENEAEENDFESLGSGYPKPRE